MAYIQNVQLPFTMQTNFCFGNYLLETRWNMSTKSSTTLSEQSQNPLKIIESGKIDTPSTQIYDRTLPCHGTCISIKGGGVQFFFWTQALPLSDISGHHLFSFTFF